MDSLDNLPLPVRSASPCVAGPDGNPGHRHAHLDTAAPPLCELPQRPWALRLREACL
jgi:hypothetical protein